MRFKLISCEVLYREMCGAVANSPHQVDVEFLPKGLHDSGCASMRKRLQEGTTTLGNPVPPAQKDALPIITFTRLR